MARATTETSIRQKAFALLTSSLAASARKDAVTSLMTELNIGKSYAMTLFQQHRNEQKASGQFTPIYSVREINGGVSIISAHVRSPSESDATSPEAAVKAYINSLESKISIAKNLDVKAAEVPKPTPAAPKPEATAPKKEATGKKADGKKASAKKETATVTEGDNSGEVASTETTA